MTARIEESAVIGGVYIVRLAPIGDPRGRFIETWRRTWIPGSRDMVQANRSDSRAGVLRGLHYHLRQADFWYVPTGSVRAIVYDFRASSRTSGASQVIEMGEGRDIGIYIPPGVAHGFHAETDAVMTYLVDAYYDGTDELGILWNDPALGLDWRVHSPVLSDRDQRNPLAAAIPPERRPR